MKSFYLIFALALLTYSFPSLALLNCKKGDTAVVKSATELYNDMENLHKEGIVKKADLLRSFIFLQEANLCSQSITTQAFCEATMPKIKELGPSGKSKYGQGSYQERQQAIALLAETKVLCEK